jgi:hypothetical protein
MNHPACNKTLSGTEPCAIYNAPLPSRCIETLKITLEDGETSWRHVLRDTASQLGQYITLSHRWDVATEGSKTTLDNLAARLDSSSSSCRDTGTQSIDGMPRLFVDACSLAYDLGIKYVWIDSICIVQPATNHASDVPSSEDLEDWNREAPMMGRYYQNAWITIAATSAAVENGLFNMRRAGPTPRITRLPYRDKTGEHKGYFYVQGTEPEVLQSEFGTDIEMSELWQRGWCVNPEYKSYAPDSSVSEAAAEL